MNEMKGVSIQALNTMFNNLSNACACVLWISSLSFSKQIYISENYKKIWGQDCSYLYEHPTAWSEIIIPEDYVRKMDNLEKRKQLDYDQNISLYRISKNGNEKQFINETAFPIYDQNNAPIAIAGFAESITENEWIKRVEELGSYNTNASKIKNDYLQILNNEFNLTTIQINKEKPQIERFIEKNKLICFEGMQIHFSRRELQCLFYLIQGCTAKQTGNLLFISARTVETYLDAIKRKTKLRTKFSIAGKLKVLLY
ncbi:MAG: PAS domain-containing protein [Proteobacteria bacterium]|nr:PAS domain-containing protein [Pseudomonadota bacterium]